MFNIKKRLLYGGVIVLTAIILSFMTLQTNLFRGAIVDFDFPATMPASPLIAKTMSVVNTEICNKDGYSGHSSGINAIQFPGSPNNFFDTDVCINHITTLSQNLREPIVQARTVGGNLPTRLIVRNSSNQIVASRTFNLNPSLFLAGRVVTFNWDGTCNSSSGSRPFCPAGDYNLEIRVEGRIDSTNINFSSRKDIRVESFDISPSIFDNDRTSLLEMDYEPIFQTPFVIGDGVFELRKIDKDEHSIKVPYSRSNRMFSLENMNPGINEDIHMIYGVVEVNEDYTVPAPVKRFVTQDDDENISIRPSFRWKDAFSSNSTLIISAASCSKYELIIIDEYNETVATLPPTGLNLSLQNVFYWDNSLGSLEYDTEYSWYLKDSTPCFQLSAGADLVAETPLLAFTTQPEPENFMNLIDGYTSIRTDAANPRLFLEWDKMCTGSLCGVEPPSGGNYSYYVLAMVYNNYNKFFEFVNSLRSVYNEAELRCATSPIENPLCNNPLSQVYNGVLNGMYHLIKLLSGQMQFYLIPIELVAPSLENEGVVVGVRDGVIDATRITFVEEVPFEGDVIVYKQPTSSYSSEPPALCELTGTITNGVLELSFVDGTAGCLFDKGVVDFSIESNDATLDDLEKPDPAQIQVCLDEDVPDLGNCIEMISDEDLTDLDRLLGEFEQEIVVLQARFDDIEAACPALIPSDLQDKINELNIKIQDLRSRLDAGIPSAEFDDFMSEIDQIAIELASLRGTIDTLEIDLAIGCPIDEDNLAITLLTDDFDLVSGEEFQIEVSTNLPAVCYVVTTEFDDDGVEVEVYNTFTPNLTEVDGSAPYTLHVLDLVYSDQEIIIVNCFSRSDLENTATIEVELFSSGDEGVGETCEITGQVRDVTSGECVCPEGQVVEGDACVPSGGGIESPLCPTGQFRNSAGVCVPSGGGSGSTGGRTRGTTTSSGSVARQTSASLQQCHFYFRDEPRLNERECSFLVPLREARTIDTNTPNPIVTGDGFNGTFGIANLSRSISRQEFFTITNRLYRHIGMQELPNLDPDSLLRFTDINRPILVDSANGWWIMPVTEQVARGVVRGYGDGTLRRLNPITGFETGKVAAEILLPFRNDDTKNPWFTDTQELYRRAGVPVSGDNYTRGQAFELVYRTMLLREALGQN